MMRDIHHIHMVGICGTAMGAVAGLLTERGYRMTGSDAAAYPPMSTLLAEHGIRVIEGYSPENLDPAPDLVIIGNALSRGNEEVEAVLDRKLRYTSLAETLKEFFIRGTTSLVVTGTHGKTTTSSMLAWLLAHAGRQPGFMIGGVPENFGVGAQEGDGRYFVTEGDEYDTAFFDKRSKFVHYLPDGVIVNNIEFDHADIFASIDDIELSFRRMLNLIPRNGVVVANAADERVMRLTADGWATRVTFDVESNDSPSRDADWRARNLREDTGGTVFDLTAPAGSVECRLSLFGKHNIANAVAAAALAGHVGLSLDEIAAGLESFAGVRRRLQRLPSRRGLVIYDDFAHHPTAIDATMRAVRAAHPDRRVWAVFEPRSNTTVRSAFQAELAQALSLADVVLLGAIHRRDSIPAEQRLDIEQLLRDISSAGSTAMQFDDVDEIVEYAVGNSRDGDVITIMSNGAFGGLAKKLPAATMDSPGSGPA